MAKSGWLKVIGYQHQWQHRERKQPAAANGINNGVSQPSRQKASVASGISLMTWQRRNVSVANGSISNKLSASAVNSYCGMRRLCSGMYHRQRINVSCSVAWPAAIMTTNGLAIQQ